MPDAKSKSLTAQALESQFQHYGTLIAAAISFGLALALGALHPLTPILTGLTGAVSIDLAALIQQAIAGALFVIGVVLTFIKQRFGVSFSAVIANKEAIAVGSVLMLIGNTLLGLAGTAPDLISKSVLSILGGIFVLLAVYLGGTVGSTLSAQLAEA